MMPHVHKNLMREGHPTKNGDDFFIAQRSKERVMRRPQKMVKYPPKQENIQHFSPPSGMTS
jgi:hypothetical protein